MITTIDIGAKKKIYHLATLVSITLKIYSQTVFSSLSTGADKGAMRAVK
jgi:hypothetical protein